MGGVWFGVQGQRAVRQHMPDAVRHPALPPCQCSGVRVCLSTPRFLRTAPVPCAKAQKLPSPRKGKRGVASLFPDRGQCGSSCLIPFGTQPWHATMPTCQGSGVRVCLSAPRLLRTAPVLCAKAQKLSSPVLGGLAERPGGDRSPPE